MAKSYGLKDIAERVGVSVSTVSRVLNNKLNKKFTVKEEIRQNILRVAEEFNYKPSLIALSLKQKKMDVVHIIGGFHALTELGNIYQTVVNAIIEEIDATDNVFEVTVNMSNPKKDINELPPWQISGIIILQGTTPETQDEIERTRTPYVVVNGPAGPNGLSVLPDDIQGTQLAMEHLIGLGHQKIAYAPPPPKYFTGNHTSLKDRHQTYLSQLKKHNLTPPYGHDTAMESAEAFIQKAVLDEGTTAILAYGHMGGLHLLQAAHKLGVEVPSRLSLLCFCDAYANSVMSPELSFIDLRSRQMGKAAAQLLLKQLDKKDKPSEPVIRFPEELVLRNSTASVPTNI